MIIEYIFNVMEKYGWDELNDEQKFNIALYSIFDVLSEIIWKSNPSSKQEFEKSIAEVDFSSVWVNIYFEYAFWLAIDFLSEKKYWFVAPLLTSSSELGLRYIQYCHAKDQVESHIDYGREYKQCEILFRNKKLK